MRLLVGLFTFDEEKRVQMFLNASDVLTARLTQY